MTNFKAALSNRCIIHGAELVSTKSYAANGLVAKSFLSCPLCNTEQIDRLAKQPGTITINVTISARRVGRTELIRKALKDAIDKGANMYMPQSPPAAPET